MHAATSTQLPRTTQQNNGKKRVMLALDVRCQPALQTGSHADLVVAQGVCWQGSARSTQGQCAKACRAEPLRCSPITMTASLEPGTTHSKMVTRTGLGGTQRWSQATLPRWSIPPSSRQNYAVLRPGGVVKPRKCLAWLPGHQAADCHVELASPVHTHIHIRTHTHPSTHIHTPWLAVWAAWHASREVGLWVRPGRAGGLP